MASTSSTIEPTSAPDASLVLFARGVIARLAAWETLRLAVDEGWGGPESAQKRTWMASVIVDAFDPAESSETPDAMYLEEMLLQIMADEFDVILEDGSAELVARNIMNLWQLKDEEERAKAAVSALEEQANKLKGKRISSRELVQDQTEVDGSGSEWEDEDEETDDADEAPQLLNPTTKSRREEPQVDDEGFTTVTNKGKGHR